MKAGYLMNSVHPHESTPKAAPQNGPGELVHSGYFEAFWQYIETLSSIAVVILDTRKTILYGNHGFLRLVGLNEIESGRNIEEFLIPESNDALIFPQAHVFEETRLNFKTASSIVHSLTCYMFNAGDGLVLFCEKPMPLASEVIEKISDLNTEISKIARELQHKNRELERANATITRLMNTDPLTGIANRRCFMENFSRFFSAAVRHDAPLSLVMADLDHFKKINDTWGHDAGDEVLKAFSAILRDVSRHEDAVARFGGEEFIVALPHTDLAGAIHFAERVRKTLESSVIGTAAITVTSSFGVVQLQADEPPESFLKRVDNALYTAKSGGRNRVSA